MKDIRRRAAALTPATNRPFAPDTASLFARFDGLWWGENPEAGVFHGNQFLQPSIGFTITFPVGWKHQNTPQYVIAAHPKQEAILLLGIAGAASDPEAAGTKLIERMRTQAGVEPVSTRRGPLGEFPAFVVTYLDRSGRAPAYLHYAWVVMGGNTYRLIGLSPETHREELRNAALSLRPLTGVERSAVTGKRLRIVTAREGERVETVSARTGNAWSPAYTAIANGLDVEGVLREGQLIKIARTEAACP